MANEAESETDEAEYKARLRDSTLDSYYLCFHVSQVLVSPLNGLLAIPPSWQASVYTCTHSIYTNAHAII